MSGVGQSLKYPSLTGETTITADVIDVGGIDVGTAIDDLEDEIQAIQSDYVSTTGLQENRLTYASGTQSIEDAGLTVGGASNDIISSIERLNFDAMHIDSTGLYATGSGADMHVVADDTAYLNFDAYGTGSGKLSIGYDGIGSLATELLTVDSTTINALVPLDLNSNNISNVGTINGITVDDLSAWGTGEYSAGEDDIVVQSSTSKQLKSTGINISELTILSTNAVLGASELIIPNHVTKVLSGGDITMSSIVEDNGAVSGVETLLMTPNVSDTELTSFFTAQNRYDIAVQASKLGDTEGVGLRVEHNLETQKHAEYLFEVNSDLSSINPVAHFIAKKESGATTARPSFKFSNDTTDLCTFGHTNAITLHASMDANSNSIINVPVLDHSSGMSFSINTNNILSLDSDSALMHYPLYLSEWTVMTPTTNGAITFDLGNSRIAFGDGSTTQLVLTADDIDDVVEANADFDVDNVIIVADGEGTNVKANPAGCWLEGNSSRAVYVVPEDSEFRWGTDSWSYGAYYLKLSFDATLPESNYSTRLQFTNTHGYIEAGGDLYLECRTGHEIYADKNINITGGLVASTTIHADGEISTDTNLDVAGNLDVGGTLDVVGATNLAAVTTTGLVTANELNVTTNADITGNATIDGNITATDITATDITSTGVLAIGSITNVETAIDNLSSALVDNNQMISSDGSGGIKQQSFYFDDENIMSETNSRIRFGVDGQNPRFTVDIDDDEYIRVGNGLSSGDTLQLVSFGSINIISDSNNNSSSKEVVIGTNGDKGSYTKIASFKDDGEIDFEGSDLTNIGSIDFSGADITGVELTKSELVITDTNSTQFISYPTGISYSNIKAINIQAIRDTTNVNNIILPHIRDRDLASGTQYSVLKVNSAGSLVTTSGLYLQVTYCYTA